MAWRIDYLPEVYSDLRSLGKPEARRILKVIETRIAAGEPDKLGKPLRSSLAGCRRIRTGNTRIVYRVDNEKVSILVVAVGMRRGSEVYKSAEKRLS
ncbi:type II toxin-antitoxin system RelE family toxin [Endozoicomonas arenosclerae]|uniref:type II toxin-antitoxin system RelE family toxin n=1 Tax=Endozoicomonas arenosclerae TaxID=1633495 RepID=UPI0007838D46|nr:type II toxin-antitoxin system RelE/ParE family toxin [Endozoicomonas arenosclerae]